MSRRGGARDSAARSHGQGPALLCGLALANAALSGSGHAQTGRQTDRQRDRQTDRQTDRKKERKKEMKERERETDGERATETKGERKREREGERHGGKEALRKPTRKIERERESDGSPDLRCLLHTPGRSAPFHIEGCCRDARRPGPRRLMSFASIPSTVLRLPCVGLAPGCQA